LQIYIWRRHFAGLAPNDVKRLKALELENGKVKRLVAERDLELDLMREVNRRKW
jgi:putative transposase